MKFIFVNKIFFVTYQGRLMEKFSLKLKLYPMFILFLKIKWPQCSCPGVVCIPKLTHQPLGSVHSHWISPVCSFGGWTIFINMYPIFALFLTIIHLTPVDFTAIEMSIEEYLQKKLRDKIMKGSLTDYACSDSEGHFSIKNHSQHSLTIFKALVLCVAKAYG